MRSRRDHKTLSIGAAVAVAVALGGAGAYLLFSYSPLAMVFSNTPDLPTDGILAVGSGGEEMYAGGDQVAGNLNLDDGCATLSLAGSEVVLVFRSGAATVNDDHTDLRWNDKSYPEGSKLSVKGEVFDSLKNLNPSHSYFLPGGCLQFDSAIFIDHLPEG